MLKKFLLWILPIGIACGSDDLEVVLKNETTKPIMVQTVSDSYSMLNDDVVEGMEIGIHEDLIITVHFLLSKYFEHISGQTFLDGMKFKFVDSGKIGKEGFEIHWEKGQVTLENKELESYKIEELNSNTKFSFSVKEK